MPAVGRCLPKTPHGPERTPRKKSCDQLPFRLFIGVDVRKPGPEQSPGNERRGITQQGSGQETKGGTS